MCISTENHRPAGVHWPSGGKDNLLRLGNMAGFSQRDDMWRDGGGGRGDGGRQSWTARLGKCNTVPGRNKASFANVNLLIFLCKSAF